jgi:hypothetical protein
MNSVGIKVDMSPNAVTRRLRKVGELVRACHALSRRRKGLPVVKNNRKTN